LGSADDDTSQSQEEQREQAAIERFKKVLEANPRRGVALDRLYGFHVERGTLDQLIGQYLKRAAGDANDGAALMVAGLLEAQRGRDAAAANAFRGAEKRLTDSALPAYYLGQSLVLVGQPDAAAEAFERAITRKPSRTDLLEIFQALGRVYQRAQRPEKALSVWTRLEELFPDDPRVEEEIASTLIEEGQAEQALPRIEKLAKQVQDPYRRTTLLVEAADLKVRLKRTADALADLEALIGELSPESWLYRDVRRRIEEVFLRNDDLAGLTKYYEQWLAKNPQDLEAFARLARTLSSQSRGGEASKWLRQGLDVAPSNKGLRQALIDQLAYERQFSAAGKEYEALDHADPNNPDVLRDWGKLLLRDSSRPEADRKQAALSIWKRLLDNKPNDAVTAAQVADLVRSAGLTDEAIALYKKAVELAPTSAQYREYLGEYLHSLKRSDEALAAWRPIAEGPNRTAKNLARLSEVLAGFGYRKQAIEALAESLKLEKDDFNRILTLADLLHEDGRHDEALAQLDIAARLASSAEESESVLQSQLKIYQATDTLTSRTEDLQKQLDSGTEATAERWHRLARYYEAAREPAEATAAVLKALEKDPKSIAILTSAARIQESGGNLLAAADTFRKLAAVDRRFRTEHLTAVAKLEQRLGRREQAMQAGRDLLAAAPGNPDHHKFFAELCFQLGDPEEGLESLRRSVRANPSDPEGLLTLGQALANRQRPGEAIELFWRALDKTDDLDGKLSVVGRLAELCLTSNQFDRLLERLDHQRRETDKNREMTLCIAQAYQRAGDISAARQELERLLTEQSRDTALLFQLSQLAEAESDLAAAVKYQRRVLAVTPANHDAQLRLAQLLVRSGESDEAAEIWVKLVAGEPEPHRNLQAIDQLVANRKFDTVLAITARLLAQKPGDWELLYREGASLAALDRATEAMTRFQALLALKLSDDTEGAALKFEKKKKPTTASAMANASAGATTATFAPLARFGSEFDAPLARRINEISFLRAFTGLEPQLNYAYSQSFRGWAPRDFGQARMASLGWLLGFSTAQNSQTAFLNSYRPPKDKATADPRRIWDWYYVQLVRQDSREAFEASRLLAALNDPAGQYAFLSSLGNRGRSSSRYYRPGTNADHTPPLPADQVELMLAAYRKLQLHNPDWLSSAIVDNVQSELRRAKRPDDEEKAYRQIVSAANTLQSVQQALSVAGQRGDVAGVTALFEKLARLQGPSKISIGQPSLRTAYPAIGQAMAVRAQQEAYQDVMTLFDLYLTAIRKQNLAAPKTLSTSRSISRSAATSQVPLYSAQPGGRGTRYVYISGAGPQANDYLDQGALILLRNAFELFKKADLLSDLLRHFDKQLDTSPPTQRVYLHLTLGALDWWNDDREEALKQLSLATQQVPDDASLVLDVAELREKNNQFEAALTLLDSVSPLDQNIMQRRELAAIRLADRTGNVARARTAAERLFGLRLDASTQIDLAGQMHRLGMHEMAEMVLNRAQRQTGNRPDALISLMNQYQSLNQTDLALQIARQILRRAPSGMSSSYRGRTSDDVNRDQAISVIARSGQLKEMIERAEAQLKSSPKSPQILQSLLDYYKAAGDKAKYKATAQRLVEAKPDEPRLRYQIAQQLQSMGEKAAAIDHLKQAIRLDPSVYSNDYWEINRLFQEQKKSDELVKVFEEIDLRKSGSNYYAYTEIVQSLLQNEATQQQGLSLLKKVWEAFPNERNYIMGNFYRDQVFQLPEMFEFAKSGLLPTDDGPSEPWRGTEELSSYNGDGRIDGIFSRTINIARQQNRIGLLRREIEGAVKKHPEWRAGKAILAVIDLQTGHPDHVRDVFRELIDDKDYPMPAITGFTLAQELDHYSGLEDLRLKLLEASVDDYLTDSNTSDEFSYSPVRQLVNYYEQADRKEDARRLIQRCLGRGQYDFDPGYGAYRRMQSAGSVAEEMLKIGEPIEAARIYNDILSDDEALALAANFGGYNRQGMESNLHRAITGLRRDNLPTAIERLLTPRNLAEPGGAALDLVLLVEPRDYQKATLVSMFEAALRASNDSPALRAEAQDKLANLAAAHPNDLSVAAAEALAALAAADPSSAQKPVERLIKLTDQAPLETLASGARANSRQRAAAFDQIGLWLVGRACLKQPALHEAGAKLSNRSVAAAHRQIDHTYAVAILREWAQIDLDHGDKQSAEARFREMIDVLLPRASSEGSDQKTAPAAVVTTDQFRQSVEFARLAAEKGLVDISLQTAAEALAGGPPAAPVSKNGPSRMIISSTAAVNTNDATSVEQSLANLVQRWRQAGARPEEIYDTLAAIVLPAARPDEVFLYSHVDYGTAGDRSVGRLLVNAAIRAGKVDDLRSRVTPRAGKALGELPGKVLLAELAIESGDSSHGLELLAELAKRLQKDTLQTTAEFIGGAAVSAIEHKELAGAAIPIIEQAAKNLAISNRIDEVQALLLRVVRFQLEAHNEPAARKAFNEITEITQRLASRNNEYYMAQQAEQLAREYARAGWAAESLAELGKHVDVASTNQRFGPSEPVAKALAPLARRLLELPAGVRYELLRTWTMPTQNRRSIRMAFAEAPRFAPPADFGRLTKPAGPCVSTVGLLIEAAQQCGKLDELANDLEPLAKDKVENADTLRLIVALTRGHAGESETELSQRLSEIVARAKPAPQPLGPVYYDDGNRPSSVRWSDIHIAHAAATSQSTTPIAERMLKMLFEQARQRNDQATLAQVDAEMFAIDVRRSGTSAADLAPSCGLEHWSNERLGSVWVSADGHIQHALARAWPVWSSLMFDCPLGGMFEFSIDSYSSPGQDGPVGFAGLAYAPLGGGTIAPLGEHETINRRVQMLFNNEFNRITIQASPEKVRCLINGQLFYEDAEPGPTLSLAYAARASGAKTHLPKPLVDRAARGASGSSAFSRRRFARLDVARLHRPIASPPDRPRAARRRQQCGLLSV
jgi:tetratricopeptide (TPR) repeat protein